MRLDEVDKEISQSDIDQLERFADKLFAKVGIDVEFTKHFLDRVNDERNKKQITMSELTRLFKQEFKKWGKPIAQMGPDAEAVMKDLSTDINMPFVLKWDRDNKELDLVAKSVMRKPDFKTSNQEFPVESKDDEYEPHMMYKGTKNDYKAKFAKKKKQHDRLDKAGYNHDDPATKKVEEMPIPKSTMYGLVINGEYVAKGSKANMRRLQKEKGGTVYNAPGKKVGDKEGTVKEDEGIIAPKRNITPEEKLEIFNELKFGDTIYLWYDSAFKRGEKYKPFKMGRRTKSEKYNLSKFSMQQISAEGIPGGVKFFLYNRDGKISLAMGDMAATIVDIQTENPSTQESVVENYDDTEEWYYQEVADHMGASLMNYKEMPGGRDITFGYKGQEVLVSQRWNKDGTEKKPVTKIVTDNDSADLGRYAVWNDSRYYADDIKDVLSKMDDDVEEGYGSKKPLSQLGGYGNKKLAKKQPSVGDGLSEFYVIVEYQPGKAVKQSDPLRVLDNLASRKDNDPFPIKFYDGEVLKVTPDMARRFTMAYHDIMKPEQKELVKNYIKTKNGFKEIVKKMKIVGPQTGKQQVRTDLKRGD
jgi:hypothetical protein